MKKQLLVMISILCLMASPAFAGLKHFEDITQSNFSINPTYPACAPGTFLTNSAPPGKPPVFICTSALLIGPCPPGQAFNAENANGLTAGAATGTATCVDMKCPNPGEVLSYTDTSGALNAVPHCMQLTTCNPGDVLTFGVAAPNTYSCTHNVWVDITCPAGQALNSNSGATDVPTCENVSCKPGYTLNYPNTGGPPTCILPPTCPAGQALTMHGTTYSCTSYVQTIACPANTAVVSIAANGVPTCIAVPSGGTCPAGQAISSVNINGVSPTCVSVPGSGACPAGFVVQSLNANGAPPTCVAASAPVSPPVPPEKS